MSKLNLLLKPIWNSQTTKYINQPVMKKILVTDCLRYIGSHTVVELVNAGFETVIIDNLYNSSIDVLECITKITGKKPQFVKLDLREKNSVTDFFKENEDIEGFIHFAASKA